MFPFHGSPFPMLRIRDVLLLPFYICFNFGRGILAIAAVVAWQLMLVAVSVVYIALDLVFGPRLFLQSLSVFIITLVLYNRLFVAGVFLSISSILVCCGLIFVPVIYLLFMYVDRNKPKYGGRRSKWVRDWILYEYLRDYFPIRIWRTVYLHAQRNYIFCYHPNGVTSVGATCYFASDAAKFSEIFPRITPYILTLPENFTWPFFREFLMATGFVALTEESMRYLLTSPLTGKALIYLPGGPAEMKETYPGSTTVEIRNNYDLIKAALKFGAALVPVYAFGQNDIYSVINGPQGSFRWRMKQHLKRILGYDKFHYGRGILPYRKPINIVVGDAVPFPVDPNPSRFMLETMHTRYVTALTDLFEAHKDRYGYGGCHLNLIDTPGRPVVA